MDLRHFVSVMVLAGACLLLAPLGLSQSIRVPGFQAGDGEKYHYSIMRFNNVGRFRSGGSVDENGLLHLTVVDSAFVNGQEVGWEHFYIYSQDHVTGENRYSFDLENFPLVGFVRSLGMAQTRLPPPGVILRDPSTEGLLRIEVADPLYADRVVPALQGENLTLEQTLDLLRQESGCDVIQTQDKLIIDWCG